MPFILTSKENLRALILSYLFHAASGAPKNDLEISLERTDWVSATELEEAGAFWDQERNRESSFQSVTKPGQEDKGHLEAGGRAVVPKLGEMVPSEEGGRGGTKNWCEE